MTTRGHRLVLALSVVVISTMTQGDSPATGAAGYPDRHPVLRAAPLRVVPVATSQALVAALGNAVPGDEIRMANGVYTTDGIQAALVIGGKRYSGTFVASRSGTQAAPIVLTGSRSAVIDAAPGANGTSTRYGFYVAGASYFEVRGITVQNAAKGIVLDQTHDSRVQGVLVQDVGQEGIHLRAFSHHNTVSQNVVRRTGLTNASYGEGLYVGSAKSNWGTYSDGQPDASDANLLVGNVVSQTGAESVDIKEGTTTGWLRDNRFDGAGMSGSYADSWVDVKGNGWEIVGNRGVNSPRDGFQVHEVLSGWGVGNLFRDNTANVRGPGYGFWLQSDSSAGVSCANVVRNAAAGFANRPCQP